MKELQVILSICAIYLCLLLFSTLKPWIDELSGKAEEETQTKLNAESCPGTQYYYVDDVLYCDYEGRLVKPKDYKRLTK